MSFQEIQERGCSARIDVGSCTQQEWVGQVQGYERRRTDGFSARHHDASSWPPQVHSQSDARRGGQCVVFLRRSVSCSTYAEWQEGLEALEDDVGVAALRESGQRLLASLLGFLSPTSTGLSCVLDLVTCSGPSTQVPTLPARVSW